MADVEQETKSTSSSGGRGPSYPFIDLREAVDRTKKFFKEEGKAPAPVSAAVKCWGYSEKSSGGRQTIAALLQYGLLRDEGSADLRRVSLTKRALDILLHEEGSVDQLMALREAAKAPKIYSEILRRYADTDLPSDNSLRHYLITAVDVSPGAADTLIKNFRASISYAKLLSSDNIPLGEGDKSPPPPPPSVEVGDYVQWESFGVLRFESPKRVRDIQEHEGISWVFVDGSDTGIPMDQTIIEQKGGAAAPGGRVITPPISPQPIAQIQPMGSQEREWLRGPLSKESSYRLLVSGDLGPKEISKLIKLLEAQRAVLSDDEETGQ